MKEEINLTNPGLLWQDPYKFKVNLYHIPTKLFSMINLFPRKLENTENLHEICGKVPQDGEAKR